MLEEKESSLFDSKDDLKELSEGSLSDISPDHLRVSRSGSVFVGEFKIGPTGMSMAARSDIGKPGPIPFSKTRRLSRVQSCSSKSSPRSSSADSTPVPGSPYVSSASVYIARYTRRSSDSTSCAPESVSHSPTSQSGESPIPPSPLFEPFSSRSRRPSCRRISLPYSSPRSLSLSPDSSSSSLETVTNLAEIRESPAEPVEPVEPAEKSLDSKEQSLDSKEQSLDSKEQSLDSKELFLPPSTSAPAEPRSLLISEPTEEKALPSRSLFISITDSPAIGSRGFDLETSTPLPGFDFTPQAPVNGFVFYSSPSIGFRQLESVTSSEESPQSRDTQDSSSSLSLSGTGIGGSLSRDPPLDSSLSLASSSQVSASKAKTSKESPSRKPNFGGSQIPFSIDDVIPLGDIGEGQNGRVVKGFHLATFTRIALKSVNICSAASRQQVATELNLYSKLSGSSFAFFLGACFQIDKSTVIVGSEFMDCGSLENVVSKYGPIPEPALRYLARKLVTALSTLQENNILHRDLKPQNILCDHRGGIKLADFGIAKELSKSSPTTRSFVGTTSYLSPERLKSEEYGFPSDIWGLGLILLYCATGGRLGLPDGYWNLMQTVLTSPPRLPKDKEFSDDFTSFVHECLEIDPEKRATCKKLRSHRFLRHHLTRSQTSKAELEHWLAVLEPDQSEVDEIFRLLIYRTSFSRYFTKSKLEQMSTYYKLQSTTIAEDSTVVSPSWIPSSPFPPRPKHRSGDCSPLCSDLTSSGWEEKQDTQASDSPSTISCSARSAPRRLSVLSPSKTQSPAKLHALSTKLKLLDQSPEVSKTLLPVSPDQTTLPLRKTPISPLKRLTASPLVLSTSVRRLGAGSATTSPLISSDRALKTPPSSYEFNLAFDRNKSGDLLWVIDRLADQFGMEAIRIVQHLQSFYS